MDPTGSERESYLDPQGPSKQGRSCSIEAHPTAELLNVWRCKSHLGGKGLERVLHKRNLELREVLGGAVGRREMGECKGEWIQGRCQSLSPAVSRDSGDQSLLRGWQEGMRNLELTLNQVLALL